MSRGWLVFTPLTGAVGACSEQTELAAPPPRDAQKLCKGYLDAI